MQQHSIQIAPLRDYLLQLQRTIVNALSAQDGKAFVQDGWQRPQGGDGLSCVLEDGHIFERAGVNFSHVMGVQLPPSATAQRPDLAGCPYEALGVSLVIHPRNPFVPTVHFNIRCFVAHTPTGAVWWFGGGMDLTPYYGFAEDAIHFHQTCYNALGTHAPQLYPRFKQACDQYFYLKHRQEPRGIGGIFFDDFNELPFEDCFHLWQSIGDHFLPAYQPIVEKRHTLPYTDAQRDFQAFRRGRYVEFNLVWDRGTLFGLQSQGRTESILVSMPPVVRWGYQWQPEQGSPEAQLYSDFLIEKDWLGLA